MLAVAVRARIVAGLGNDVGQAKRLAKADFLVRAVERDDRRGRRVITLGELLQHVAVTEELQFRLLFRIGREWQDILPADVVGFERDHHRRRPVGLEQGAACGRIEVARYFEPARLLEAAQCKAEAFALLPVDHARREAVRAHQHLGVEQGAVDFRARAFPAGPRRRLWTRLRRWRFCSVEFWASAALAKAAPARRLIVKLRNVILPNRNWFGEWNDAGGKSFP